jgi:streptogramin lyase
VLAVLAILLAGCGGAPATPAPTVPPASAPASPSASPSGVRVQAVIDLGGQEAYGLAIHDGAVWAISYQAGTLSRVDPATGKVTRTVTLRPGPATLLSTGDALWAAAYGASPADATLYRIDPGTGAAAARISPGEVCCDLTAGGGSVWAVDPRGSLMQIDPVRAAVTRRFPVAIDRTVHTNAVYAGDSVWVSSDSTKLFRVRVKTGAVETVDAGGGVPFLAHEGLVWGAAPDRLWAVDAAKGIVVRQIPLQNSMEVISLGLGFGAIWVGMRHPGYVGAVLRLDPGTGAVLDELREVKIPARIEFGFESVWITDSGSSSLYRLSPPT